MSSISKLDLSLVLSTISTYPYNILVGVATLGTAILAVRSHFSGGVCRSKAKLNGKTVIITGANTGIGKETAIGLAKRKADRVILACRNDSLGKKAVEDVKKASCNENVEYRHIDLASLASVQEFAQGILDEGIPVDILINNAGIMRCPYWKTEDGFEMQFGINHLGHFLLTNLLLERMKQSPSARIINVSSKAYRWCDGINFDDINSKKSYDPRKAYGQSKLANVLFTKVLAEKLKGTSVTAYSLHPGVIMTDLGRHMMKNYSALSKLLFLPIIMLFFKTAPQGAQTTIYCAVSEEVEGVSGRFYSDCKEASLTTAASKDRNMAEKLWDISERMVGLK